MIPLPPDRPSFAAFPDPLRQWAEADGAIAFGSQIRTYTLQPYRLVKDHRTGTETSNVDAVLDGNVDAFIHNYLLYLHGKS